MKCKLADINRDPQTISRLAVDYGMKVTEA